MNSDIKIGKLLCDEDIITKRQLNQALQLQVKGDKRTLGEILVDKDFCSINDITSAMMKTSDEHDYVEKQEEITEKVEKNEPVELSEEKVMGTKFSMSVQTIVGLVTLIATGVGGYYMLLQEIEEAKQLPLPPSVEEIFEDEYPSRPDGHNWPRSKEQYKQQVGGLQDDMDDVFETVEELEEEVKDLKKLVSDLRVQVANKRDK